MFENSTLTATLLSRFELWCQYERFCNWLSTSRLLRFHKSEMCYSRWDALKIKKERLHSPFLQCLFPNRFRADAWATSKSVLVIIWLARIQRCISPLSFGLTNFGAPWCAMNSLLVSWCLDTQCTLVKASINSPQTGHWYMGSLPFALFNIYGITYLPIHANVQDFRENRELFLKTKTDRDANKRQG